MGKSTKILLIYTGGTIGMMKDPECGSLKAFDFNHLLEKIPELKLLDCTIEATSFSQPIDSSEMNPDYWLEIAEIIENNYDEFDGFVVLHGSDTMSYSASALSFMIEDLSKPIIFTGSQLPIGDLRTDAKENLITSIQIASLRKNKKPVIQEVCLYFEYKLYRANRTTKINAEHFQAFSSFNYPPLAESGVHLKINNHLLFRSKSNKPFKANKRINTDVALIKLFPGISDYVIESILSTPNLKGVILETFGSGNVFTRNSFLDKLEQSIKRGISVVVITQCAGGGVILGKYESSRLLKNLGVINGKDITTESAVSKLMYLLGQDLLQNEIKIHFESSLRGELT